MTVRVLLQRILDLPIDVEKSDVKIIDGLLALGDGDNKYFLIEPD